MNYINKYITTGLLSFCILTLISCKKWLDVPPVDRFTEDNVFSTPNGFSEVLNGIYLSIGKPKLYGANMTSTTVDIFAQRYSTRDSLLQYQLYNFGDKKVKATIDDTWSTAYVNVLNINKFIRSLDQYPNVLDKETEDLFRGEAYALRAFLQFDMLRLFGPIYASDSLKTSIPYYTDASTKVMDILPANEVMKKVIADLQTAEKFLANDPIIKSGVIKTSQKNHLNYRNYRMNYFAVKGLQARSYLYRGDRVSALAAAKQVIDNTQKFPWITANILSNKRNPDRVFSTELLFGIQAMDLYNTYRDFFSPELIEDLILAPLPTRLSSTYENNENDYRNNPNWIQTNIKGKAYKTFIKYADIEPVSLDFRYIVPLLRISEMYYIATECTNDIKYLNIVRNNRNLVDLPNTVAVGSELQKEYQKEFYGEGQLWFFYKRLNLKSIPNASSSSGTINMNANKYVLPLPLSELNPR